VLNVAGTEKIVPNRTLDLRGLFCPEPILKTSVALGKMEVGEVIEVLADDPAAEEDFKSWARRAEQELLSVEKEGRDFRFLIRKRR